MFDLRENSTMNNGNLRFTIIFPRILSFFTWRFWFTFLIWCLNWKRIVRWYVRYLRLVHRRDRRFSPGYLFFFDLTILIYNSDLMYELKEKTRWMRFFKFTFRQILGSFLTFWALMGYFWGRGLVRKLFWGLLI